MTDTVSLVIAIVSAVLAIVSAGFSCFTYFRNVIHDRRRDTLDAYNTLQNEAAKLCANYVCIKDVNTRPNDWFLNVFSRGSGYTLTADLYR